MICAVVKKAELVFVFDTNVQSFVEDFMIDIGYGNRDYFLCFKDTLNKYAKFSVTRVRVIAHAVMVNGRLGKAWAVKKVHYEIHR